MIVATVGVSGAIVGGWVAQVYDWRTSFKIGGVLGFLLLVLRIGVSESGIFQQLKESSPVKRGNFFSLFTSGDRFKRFFLTILVGVPIWLTIGILVNYAPEFAKGFGVEGEVGTARAVMACYTGFVIGDFLFGMLSQGLKSRNRAILIAILANAACGVVYLTALRSATPNGVYLMCLLLGATGGYWAVICTVAAEQFGTNLRATVATAVPNFIRFALVPMNLGVLGLKPMIGLVNAAFVVGGVVILVALLSLRGLKDSYGRDLDFVEPI
jgi:hypothetical protein